MADYPASEDKWRAESDARTLLEAEKIKSDGDRHSRALNVVQEEISAKKKLLRSAKGKDADMAAKGYSSC